MQNFPKQTASERDTLLIPPSGLKQKQLGGLRDEESISREFPSVYSRLVESSRVDDPSAACRYHSRHNFRSVIALLGFENRSHRVGVDPGRSHRHHALPTAVEDRTEGRDDP